ncbi:DNA-3-methyladenine glycosylase [Dyadobacter sp. CY312]|uniref:DNA-3-methyladenine glycosylase n=1 Tax=Dyadobacter sp. CY312 TaxID=2907303 RepID=UPI001F265742|nr:DNA-3-methyladenine glycosylase [Dyadobacter sp. CY312]MCE7038880.1 DNA-3-methyladenine glycosylase [Dyadobacter sp. CY312]
MGDNRLPLSFYQSLDTISLARALLGCELVHDSPDGSTSGIIVETEAYLCDDPACHAFNRRTARTEPMYRTPGTIYVYLIYGMYQCINVVSNQEGIGEAVLIRALQPLRGIALMQQRRMLSRKVNYDLQKPFSVRDLCRGPGKLVQAMGIERTYHNNKSFIEGNLYITEGIEEKKEITVSPRIGINVGIDLPYRFSIKGSLYVSK